MLKKLFEVNSYNWAKNTKIILNFVQCSAPESRLIQRLKNRSHDVSDAKEDLLPSQKLSFDTICHDEELPLIELDTTKDWKKFLRAFLA